MAAKGKRPTKLEQLDRIERTLRVMAQNPGARDYTLCSMLVRDLGIDRTTAALYLRRARAYATQAHHQRIADLSLSLIDLHVDLIERCRAQNELRDETKALDGLTKIIMAADPHRAPDTTPDAIEFVTRTPGAAPDASNSNN